MLYWILGISGTVIIYYIMTTPRLRITNYTSPKTNVVPQGITSNKEIITRPIINQSTMKTCTQCGVENDTNEFPKHRRVCIPCMKEWKKGYNKNRVKQLAEQMYLNTQNRINPLSQDNVVPKLRITSDQHNYQILPKEISVSEMKPIVYKWPPPKIIINRSEPIVYKWPPPTIIVRRT